MLGSDGTLPSRGGLGGSFRAPSNLARSLKTIRSKGLFHENVSAPFRRMIASRKNLLVLTVLFASFPITCLRADEKPLSARRPTKDAMASKNHAQGAGIFEMMVDKPSGKAQGVYVRSSTKNLFLDADVINTFLQWRFKPNTVVRSNRGCIHW
jgi:hypothetical protein